MTVQTLSKKQKQILKWCHEPKSSSEYSAIICDGAVRSGKTMVMSVSFVLWAMKNFNGASFAICGKTISSTERNIVVPMNSLTDLTRFFSISYSRSNSLVTISGNGRKNYFYVFGGKDESSYMLIQGMTLSGVFFDEVALMPRSFVEQAIARTLSVSTAKLWFNCNPENPNHWFYKEWICDADNENVKQILHLHFLMTDNPVLTKADIEKASRMYSGVFRERYILGKWVAAEGLVYPMFNEEDFVCDCLPNSGEYYVSIDYGTSNPCSMGLWCVSGKKAFRIKEFYHDSRATHYQLTDEEYYQKLCELTSGYNIQSVIVDPSAASFITCIKRHGDFSVVPAKNNVLNGIRLCGSMLKSGKLMFHRSCGDIIREFSLYSWDDKAQTDSVKKEFDHALDEMRYFCYTVLQYKNGFAERQLIRASRQTDTQIITAGDFNGGWE